MRMKFVSRYFSKAAVRVRCGTAECVKGRLVSRLLAELSSLAAESGLEEGEIWIGHAGKVDFSDEIPEEMHQRIRNVICLHQEQ